MNLRKGISPVIATVIIVAVALAIAIAAVGWVMGIWGSVTGGTEILKIMPDSNITIFNNGTVKVWLHVKNDGGATATIEKVEIAGVGSGTASLTVNPGKDNDGFITISNSTAVTPGATYTVKVYTAAGNVYSTQIVAESE